MIASVKEITLNTDDALPHLLIMKICIVKPALRVSMRSVITIYISNDLTTWLGFSG